LRVVLGRVVGAHGLRGEIRVRWFGDGPENLLRAKRVELADARGAADPAPLGCEIEGGGRGRAGEVRLSLRGVERREGAEALRGRLVLIEASALPPAPEGELYAFELVGCQVELPSGERIGRVREVWSAPAQDVLVVEGADGRDRLIPVAPAVVRTLDVAARRIVIEDLPGLTDPT
jgi:16S rRNA processing protein RimM